MSKFDFSKLASILEATIAPASALTPSPSPSPDLDTKKTRVESKVLEEARRIVYRDLTVIDFENLKPMKNVSDATKEDLPAIFPVYSPLKRIENTRQFFYTEDSQSAAGETGVKIMVDKIIEKWGIISGPLSRLDFDKFGICVAGGAAAEILSGGGKSKDIDFFFIRTVGTKKQSVEERATELYDEMMKIIGEYHTAHTSLKFACSVYTNIRAITIQYRDFSHKPSREYRYQIILKESETIAHLLSNFDIASCQVALTGVKKESCRLLLTRLGAFAHTYRLNIVTKEDIDDFEWSRKNSTGGYCSKIATPFRLIKYFDRGFGMLFLQFSSRKELVNHIAKNDSIGPFSTYMLNSHPIKTVNSPPFSFAIVEMKTSFPTDGKETTLKHTRYDGMIEYKSSYAASRRMMNIFIEAFRNPETAEKILGDVVLIHHPPVGMKTDPFRPYITANDLKQLCGFRMTGSSTVTIETRALFRILSKSDGMNLVNAFFSRDIEKLNKFFDTWTEIINSFRIKSSAEFALKTS